MGSLQPVLRVNNLVNRARDRLEQAGPPPLSKLASQAERGNEDARKLLRDITAIRDGQDTAKKIDWTQHERALAQFSRAHSVEPSYGRSAPLEIRCYARALELIVDDYRRKPLRDKSLPLIEWIAGIGHPDAKSLGASDDVVTWIIEEREGAWRGKARCGSVNEREGIENGIVEGGSIPAIGCYVGMPRISAPSTAANTPCRKRALV